VSAADGKLSDANSAGLENDNSSLDKVLFEGGEVGEQERCLLVGAAFGAATEEQERRLPRAAEREQGREIGVSGDDDAVLGAGTLEISSSLAAWRP
jgi:hypothetical protein